MKRRDSDSGRELGRFVALPMAVLDSPAYMSLSAYAKSLLIDVARQYGGRNNGSLLCSRRQMLQFGWKSADTLTKALAELLEARLLFRTVQGQRPNKASWYALTWRGLDKNDGYDAGAEQTFRRGMFMTARPKPSRQDLYERWRNPAEKTQPLDRQAEQEQA